MFHFLVTNLESFASNNKFFDVPILYYPVTINESKEKLRMVFCAAFQRQKNIVAPSTSSNFPEKLIC